MIKLFSLIFISVCYITTHEVLRFHIRQKYFVTHVLFGQSIHSPKLVDVSVEEEQKYKVLAFCQFL